MTTIQPQRSSDIIVRVDLDKYPSIIPIRIMGAQMYTVRCALFQMRLLPEGIPDSVDCEGITWERTATDQPGKVCYVAVKPAAMPGATL